MIYLCVIIIYILLYFIYLHLYLFTEMMKVRPSRPSSENHYTQKEIMLQRMKVFYH
jgi:hypothetical protein